jgi:hypothetical protein
MALNSNFSIEQQLLLQIESELTHELDNIITNIKEVAQEFNIQNIQEKSPLKNILSAATANLTSLEEIYLLILYQTGRKESSKIWKLEKNVDGKTVFFAEAVVERIKSLEKNVKNIFKKVEQDISEKMLVLDNNSLQKSNLESLKSYLSKNKKRLEYSFHLKLMQLYLGYLSRHHTALTADQSKTEKNKHKG